MLNILACPIDKHYPLVLLEISVSRDDEQTNTNDETIDMGILYCDKCTRFYPIIEQIPVMLPDDLRDKQKDLEFRKSGGTLYLPTFCIRHNHGIWKSRAAISTI